MNSRRVLVTGATVDPLLKAHCLENGHSIQHLTESTDETALSRLVEWADYYLLGGDEYVSAKVLGRAHRLRCISIVGVSKPTFVDTAATTDMGIDVLNTPGANADSVAEFAVGQALALMRGIVPSRPTTASQRAYEELRDSKVGLVGLGYVGSSLARLLTAGFNCAVGYTSGVRKPHIEQVQPLTWYPDIRQLSRECKTIFLCCSLTPETVSMINQSVLAAPGFDYLVSIADPRVIDFEAVFSAVATGRLRGVAVDNEIPAHIVDNVLANQATSGLVLLTPHIAGSSLQAWQTAERQACDGLIAHMTASREATRDIR